MREPIIAPGAPAPKGAYSQAVRAGQVVFLSGQLPVDPATGELVPGDPHDAVRRCMQNLQAVCTAAGGSLDDVVKLSVCFADPAISAALDDVVREMFHHPYPARIRLNVATLSRGATVEVEAVMYLAPDWPREEHG
ncbi:Rid family detoxifying hydrolase [Streptomyces sp. NPDC005408]|uniref:Rid family detoxifying hydrolase n=1 Tax=Streptomyces sp. NPDC005408 TaxID=3155341 RepID=UPI0033A2C51E